MDKKIILFNGAPGSGKDTAATFAKHYSEMKNGKGAVIPYRPQLLWFADPIKQAVQGLYQLPFSMHHYEREKDDWKSAPQVELYGKTGREVYIHIGEGQKSLHGDAIFGKLAARRVRQEKRDNLFIFPDLGFRSELGPLVAEVGVTNVLVIRMLRDGCSYADDSRSDIANELKLMYMDKVKLVSLPNNGDKNLLRLLIHGILQEWLGIENGAAS